MFHAQNPYMTATMQPMNGRATPQDPVDWSSEIGNQPDIPYAPMNSMMNGGMSSSMNGSMNGAMNGGMGSPMNGSMSTGMTAPANQAMTPAMDPTLGSVRMRMKHNLPIETVTAPVTTEEAYRGSLKALLAQNVGNFIVATFLVGTQGTTTWEGFLYDVGNDYITIFQESRGRYVVTDIYSLKFVEFYDVERQKLCRAILQQQGL